MKCKWYADFEGVCTNGECPYRGEVCGMVEHPEVCKYYEKKANRLSVEELAEALRKCHVVGCCECPAQGIAPENCMKEMHNQAADMLEKLAAEREALERLLPDELKEGESDGKNP